MATPALYAGVTSLLEPLAVPAVTWLARGEPASLRAERLGRAPMTPATTWWHAASLGEMAALEPLLEAARARGLAGPFAVTATTRAGRTAAERLWPGRVSLAPVDLPRAVRRALAARRPRSLVVVETELWPNWLAEAARSGVHLALVNARLSDRSFPRYRRWRALFRPLVASFGAIAARTEADAQRWLELGAPPGALRVTGNCKHDRVRDVPPLELPWAPAPVVTVGSLRHGEERLVLDSLMAARKKVADLRVVVAPRHPDRWPDLESDLRSRGFRPARRSAPRSEDTEATALILDTHGELAAAYAASTVSVIGGTWIPVGGHNPLESAVGGTPVVFGPWTANVTEEADALLDRGGALRAVEPADLVAVLWRWLCHPQERAEAGAAARAAAGALRGGSGRTLDWLEGRGVLSREDA